MENNENLSVKGKLLLINDDKSNNFDVKSNNELFKQALVEGLNRRFDREIEEAKKIEQIEEMAMVLCKYHNTEKCKKCGEHPCCLVPSYAEDLYNAGYRKQSVGEWNDNIIGFCNVCMNCGAIVERSTIKNNSGKLKFCPNCGSKMKGGE